MKWLPLLLLATVLFLSSCATPDQGMGKIGPDYDNDPTVGAARAQNMHGSIVRGSF